MHHICVQLFLIEDRSVVIASYEHGHHNRRVSTL